MSLLEGLFDLLKDVKCSDKDNLVDGFIIEPIRKGYTILHEKNIVYKVNFIDKEKDDSKICEDIKVAQNNPKNYKVIITEINDEERTKIYIKKLLDLGFEEISQD